jgi:hypothetical protein
VGYLGRNRAKAGFALRLAWTLVLCHVGEGAAPWPGAVADGILSGRGEGWKQWWAAVRREAAVVMAVRLSLFEKEGYCLAAPLGGKL